MEQFTCTMVYYGIPSYIFIPPWYKYLIPWYATVYHSTTLCNYGTSMVQITYTMVCYPLYTIYYSAVSLVTLDLACNLRRLKSLPSVRK